MEKSELQEWCQRELNNTRPFYNRSRVGGPDHAPLFRCTVTVGQRHFTGAVCHSFKEAERSAARAALQEVVGDRHRRTVVLIDGQERGEVEAWLQVALRQEVLDEADVILFTEPPVIYGSVDICTDALEVVYGTGHTHILFSYLGCFLASDQYETYVIASQSPLMPDYLATLRASTIALMHWPLYDEQASGGGGVKLVQRSCDLLAALFDSVQ